MTDEVSKTDEIIKKEALPQVISMLAPTASIPQC
jgi:hypothetical protein